MQRTDRLHKRISSVAVRKEPQMQNSRDFGVAFWIIGTIDFSNFQPSPCIARVPTIQIAFCS